MSVWYLDLDDEITDAVARLRAAQDERVVLVLPPGSRIGTGRINFRLLAREADSRHVRLALVSGDAQVRAMALAAGLRSCATVPEAEAALDKPDEPLDQAVVDAAAAAVAASATASRSTAAGPGTPSVALGAGGTAALAPPAATTRGPLGRFRRREPEASATGGFGVTPRAASAATPGAAGWTDVAGEEGVRAVARRGRRYSARGIGVRVALVTGVLAVSAYGAWNYLPRARITIVPRVASLPGDQVTIVADPTLPQASPGNVRAELITFPLATSNTFPATGQGLRLDRAKGFVRFTSVNEIAQFIIPKDTKVSTQDGFAFRTTETKILPKAPPSSRSDVLVPVEAAKPGPEGNVPAGKISVLPPALGGNRIVVDNPRPTTGGKSTPVPEVTESDVREAHDRLLESLDTQLRQKALDPAIVPAGLTAYPETAAYDASHIDWDPARDSLPGRNVDSFPLEAAVIGTVVAVDEAQVAAAAKDGYVATTEATSPGLRVLPHTVTAEVGRGRVGEGVVTYTVTVGGDAYTRPDPRQLLPAIKGRSLDEARAALAALGTVTISMWPEFIPSIPDDEARIEIDITPPDTSQEESP
jgi:hypothetical protein